MPKGPKGEKRPADVVGNAIKIAKIATGEEEEDSRNKKAHAIKGGLKGGVARAKALTQEERSEIAKIAATARWKKS